MRPGRRDQPCATTSATPRTRTRALMHRFSTGGRPGRDMSHEGLRSGFQRVGSVVFPRLTQGLWKTSEVFLLGVAGL